MLVIVRGYAANCVVLGPGLSCIACVSFHTDRYNTLWPKARSGDRDATAVRRLSLYNLLVRTFSQWKGTLPSYTTAERLVGFRPVSVAQETEISASRKFTVDTAVPPLSAAAAAAAAAAVSR